MEAHEVANLQIAQECFQEYIAAQQSSGKDQE